ncbi:MAG TPA: glutaredoxin domain-containing protein, partial [Steroidobacteraceae bacterium]|nr:glutaredoxin domain-containing protein [Steroidobacteraceae bacterium]
MQGWTPDFIAGVTEQARDEQLMDRIVPVKGSDAMRMSRELARREGIFTGITGGATLAGALSIAAQAPGSRILALLPDTGERYQSTPLFADIAAEMNEEELAISRSTPGARFDLAAAAPAAAIPPPAVTQDVEADEAVTRAISDPEQPVVMFALEWCEFCWSVRRLFSHLGIAFRSIDLDAAVLQERDFGSRLRAALSARTGIVTIPQIFVGGTLLGGATDVIEAHRAGKLQSALADLGITCRQSSTDPRSFLPGWLHPR